MELSPLGMIFLHSYFQDNSITLLPSTEMVDRICESAMTDLCKRLLYMMKYY